MNQNGEVVVVIDPSPEVATLRRNSAQSWILLNNTGQATLLDVDRHWITVRVHIHGRDLRILDPLLSYPSTILGRERAIVLNLEHIKAIITAQEALLRNPVDEAVVQELQRRLASDDDESDPFELHALEVALEAICKFVDARTTELETATYRALNDLKKKTRVTNLDRVCELKTAMSDLKARVLKVRDELEKLLDDDSDMAKLYLSRKLETVGGDHDNGNEELEMILEVYFKQIVRTLTKLAQLRKYTHRTKKYIKIVLDNRRNELMELKHYRSTSTAGLGVNICSMVFGAFGMNIPFTWNQQGHGYMFKWVCIATGTLSFFVTCILASTKG